MIFKNFYQYATINTTANPANIQATPTSEGQIILCDVVLEQLRQLGCINVYRTEEGIGRATLPATAEGMPAIALMPHLDTATDWRTDTHPQLIENYQGGDIRLNAEATLMPTQYPELLNYIGQDLVVTDGTSLLGADDKLAIAEIVEALTYLQAHPERCHGRIEIALLPDEEIGLLGAKNLDVNALSCQYGICLDCCGIGEYVVENWYAAHIDIMLVGKTAHPMNSKGNMRNSVDYANEIMSFLADKPRPCDTEGKEGYFWVQNIQGSTAKTTMRVILRSFYKEELQHMIHSLTGFIDQQMVPRIDVSYHTSIDYVNPISHIENLTSLIPARMEKLNIQPKPLTMRGGYDGSYLSGQGLPTINIFTGAHNFHSNMEYFPIQSAEKAVELLVDLLVNPLM